jgi:hypothetical protein
VRRAYLALVAAVLWAGCLGPAAPANDDNESGQRTSRLPHVDEGAWGRHNFSASYDLFVQGTRLVVWSSINANNCVVFQDTIHSILQGNLTATWSARTPLSETLEIVALARGGASQRSTGASPLTLSIRDLVPQGSGPNSIYLLVQPADMSGAVDQSVRLDVAFEYAGSDRAAPKTNYSCVA